MRLKRISPDLCSSLGLYLSKIANRHQGELLEDGMALGKGVALEGMSLRKDKSALFSEFSVVLMLYETSSGDEFEVEIPVENDELQISKAKVPGKIILEVAK